MRIFDLVDETDGTLGLVMELLRGGTLEACMRERGPLSTLQALAVATAILSALNHVHQKGIVHRDVKPANIFFAVEPDGHVIPKILDFGIAKLPAASSALTVDGSVLGTPHYMAPEQIRGIADIDGRSDMFSLASLLYEMLTGVRPFQRDSAAASLAAVLEHEVDPDPRIEPRLWVAISRALAKRPYERFATCAEFAEALRAAVEAGDEEFAAALQELRPRSDAIPESEGAKLGGLSSPSSSSSSAAGIRKRKRGGPQRSVVWALGAAAVAAVLAVTATLAVTRSGTTPAHADEGPKLAEARSGTTPSVAAPGSSGRDAVPPPVERAVGAATEATTASSPSTTPAVATGTVIPTPLAVAGTANVSPAGGGNRPLPVARPIAAPPRPTTTTKPLPPPGKPIATSPGF